MATADNPSLASQEAALDSLQDFLKFSSQSLGNLRHEDTLPPLSPIKEADEDMDFREALRSSLLTACSQAFLSAARAVNVKSKHEAHKGVLTGAFLQNTLSHIQ